MWGTLGFDLHVCVVVDVPLVANHGHILSVLFLIHFFCFFIAILHASQSTRSNVDVDQLFLSMMHLVSLVPWTASRASFLMPDVILLLCTTMVALAVGR